MDDDPSLVLRLVTNLLFGGNMVANDVSTEVGREILLVMKEHLAAN